MINSKSVLAVSMMGMIGLAACAQTPAKQAHPIHNDKPIGMANPASEYCISKGGTLEMKRNADGEYALCHLPSGEVMEEWTLFRRDHAEKALKM